MDFYGPADDGLGLRRIGLSPTRQNVVGVGSNGTQF
jgi:hypothetical protein